jgi:hypothetical protein
MSSKNSVRYTSHLHKRRNTFCKQETEWALEFIKEGTDESFTMFTWEGARKPSPKAVDEVTKIIVRAVTYVYYFNTVIPNGHRFPCPEFISEKSTESEQ